MAKKRKPATKKTGLSGWQILGLTWRIISIGVSVLMFLIFAIFFFSIMGALVSTEALEQGNIAIIPLEGPITSNGQYGISPGAGSKDIIKLLEKAEENDDIKAILLSINSPGGTPVATDEIARAVSDSNKTVVAVIRESGASGAYWVATAADKIFANRMSMTGSIGVRGSGFGLEGLMKDYNITYRRLVSGKYKDAGSPFKEFTSAEEELFQNLLDTLHQEFISAVAENRNLSHEHVTGLATGFIYLGLEAKELGLVDELGTEEDALEYLEESLNITADPVTYKKRQTFADVLSGMSANAFYNMGRGMSSEMDQSLQVSFT